MRKRDAVLTFVFAVTAGLAYGRFTVPTRPAGSFGWPLTYEALAHVWCGLLAGAALACGALSPAIRRAEELRGFDRFKAADDLADLAVRFAVLLGLAACLLLGAELFAFFFWR